MVVGWFTMGFGEPRVLVILYCNFKHGYIWHTGLQTFLFQEKNFYWWHLKDIITKKIKNLNIKYFLICVKILKYHSLLNRGVFSYLFLKYIPIFVFSIYIFKQNIRFIPISLVY